MFIMQYPESFSYVYIRCFIIAYDISYSRGSLKMLKLEYTFDLKFICYSLLWGECKDDLELDDSCGIILNLRVQSPSFLY